MKIVSIGTLKGGAGKTTLLFNMAGVLAEHHKVLLIDLDPQCNLSGACGLTPLNDCSTRNIFISEMESSDPEVIVTHSPIPELPSLDIIPSHLLLTAVELQMVSMSAREHLLNNYIEDHATFFDQYDYVLLDTNPSMGIINQNAFRAADSIILVSDIGQDSIKGAEAFCWLWGGVSKALRLKDNVKALVINNADRRIKVTQEMIEYCQTDPHLSKLLIPHFVWGKVAYKNSRLDNKPVNVYEAGAEAAQDIRAVVADLTERGIF